MRGQRFIARDSEVGMGNIFIGFDAFIVTVRVVVPISN